MKINVFCRNRGWLFEDLKALIASKGAVASDLPLPDADAWICIRDTEAVTVPDPKRTLVQCHHVNAFPRVGYGIISFCHPFQQEKFKREHGEHPNFMLPIGARAVPRNSFAGKPTLGYFCREVGKDRVKGSDLFATAVKMAREQKDFDLLMIGENLEHIANLGKYERRAAVPSDYGRISAFCTTSTSPAVPLSCYEALAAGVPVASTVRQFPHLFGGVYFGTDEQGLAGAILAALNCEIREPQFPFSRDAWAQRQVDEARKLCKK